MKHKCPLSSLLKLVSSCFYKSGSAILGGPEVQLNPQLYDGKAKRYKNTLPSFDEYNLINIQINRQLTEKLFGLIRTSVGSGQRTTGSFYGDVM